MDIDISKALNAAREEQQHRLEKLVQNHLVEITRANNVSTELEIVMQSIVRQFIDAVKDERKRIKDYSPIYLKD